MKLIIFDFDGVIVDSKRLWASAVYRALRKRGYKFSESYIADRLKEKLRISLSKLGVKVNEAIVNDIHDDIIRHIKTIHLCKDLRHLEEIRKDAKTVLLTNSPRYFIMKALKDRKKYFDLILCAEDFDTKKDAIKRLMRKFMAKRNETFYVADMTLDHEIAKKAGCRSIIVLAHSWNKEFWKNKRYKFIIKSLKELKNAI